MTWKAGGPTAASPDEPGEAAGLKRRLSLVGRAKEEWEAAVDAVSELVFLVDERGAVLRCNLAAREALGRPFTGILQHPLVDLLRQGFHCPELDLRNPSGELRLAGGERAYEYSRFPAHRGGRTVGQVFVFRDVSELRHVQAIAARVDMMNNLGHVLSCVRHEIGNPTNALKTALTVMSESLETFPAEKLRSYVERCLDDVRRIQDLLDQLRTLNVFDVDPRDDIDLRRFLAHHLPLLEESLSAHGIHLEHRIPGPARPLAVRCDPRALYQVVLGLVANATEAMEESGRGSRIRVAISERKSFVTLAVADDGPGIDPTILDQVVLPLYTTKKGGTGLGLAIAQQMMGRMGGTLQVGNDPELGGARVSLLLVRSRPPAASPG